MSEIESVAEMLRSHGLYLAIYTHPHDLRWDVRIDRALTDEEKEMVCSGLYDEVASGEGGTLYGALLDAVEGARGKGYLGDIPIAKQVAKNKRESQHFQLDF